MQVRPWVVAAPGLRCRCFRKAGRVLAPALCSVGPGMLGKLRRCRATRTEGRLWPSHAGREAEGRGSPRFPRARGSALPMESVLERREGFPRHPMTWCVVVPAVGQEMSARRKWKNIFCWDFLWGLGRKRYNCVGGVCAGERRAGSVGLA